MEDWAELDFWRSEEWHEIEAKLDALGRSTSHYVPNRDCLFKALDLVPFNDVKVVIVGQDPYPSSKFATGVAFSIPREGTSWPPTLVSLMHEYVDDLGNNIHGDRISYPSPQHGNLESWCKQGVLLINSTWTYRKGYRSDQTTYNMHYGWKWNLLTEEVLQRLSGRVRGTIFVFLGARAQEFKECVDDKANFVIALGHPSPRAARRSSRYSGIPAFRGSRLFTTINDHLVFLKQQPIDWRL